MDRIVKLVIIASMAAAVCLEAILAARSWPAVLPLAVGTFVLACCLSIKYEEPCAAAILFFAFLFPALCVVVHGRFEIGYTAIWLAGLLGIMVPTSVREGWALPLRLRVPLVLWALTVGLAWPIVALREVDFAPRTIDVHQLSITGPPGVPPQFAVLWISHVAAILGVGILWFDWLSSRFARNEHRFRFVAIGSLAASWLVATSVAVYQLFFDVTFLNRGLFGYLKRASGTMLDANPFGVIAALGTPVVVAWACLTPRFPRALVPIVIAMSWLALWASASRTALAAGVIGTLFAAYALCRFAFQGEGMKRRTHAFIGITAVITAVSIAGVLSTRFELGPWRRLQSMSSTWSRDSVVEVMRELWNRGNYGAHASQMIRDFPYFGVGVGTFHFLVIDYSRVIGLRVVSPDNAQNWYRHQFAEFGLVGSIGWILWVASFGWFVLTTRTSGRRGLSASAVKGILVAIAFISLVGMPTQNAAVTMTFWTMAFWYVSLVTGPQPDAAGAARMTKATWLAVWAIVAMCTAGTGYFARHQLRVPSRAVTFGWPYTYGFSGPETGPAGPFRWAEKRGVIVLEAPKPWLKLSVAVNHADIARKPVDVKVWRDSEEVLRTTLTTADPIVKYVRIPGGHQRVVLDTWVSRVVRPADFGLQDSRELGLMVGWDFVDASPLDAPAAGN